MEQKEDNLIIFKFVVTFVSIALFIFLCIVWLTPFTNQEQLVNSFFYFFSSTAQTMGALFAIVLSSIYVLMTYIGSNTILSMPTKRLLLKDVTLKYSIYSFILTIIFSLFGIFLTKNLDIPFFTEFTIIPFIFAFLVLVLTIISIITLLVFIYSRGPLYTTPEILIINDIFKNNRPEKQNINTESINDSKKALYSELSLLSYSNGNHLKYYSLTSNILFNNYLNDNNMAAFDQLKNYLILDLPIINNSIKLKEDFYKDLIYNLFCTFNFKYILPFKCNENINDSISKNRKSVIDLLGDIFNIIDYTSTYEASSMFYNVLFNNYYYNGNFSTQEFLFIDLKDGYIIEFVSDFTGLLAEIYMRQKCFYSKYPNPFLFHIINIIRDKINELNSRDICKIINDIYIVILVTLFLYIYSFENKQKNKTELLNDPQINNFKEMFDVFKDFIIKCDSLIATSANSDTYKEVKNLLEHSYYEYYLYVKILFNQSPEPIFITNFSSLFKSLEIMTNKSIDMNYLKLKKYFLNNENDPELSSVGLESFRYGFTLKINTLLEIYNNLGICEYNDKNIYDYIFKYFKEQLNNNFDQKFFMYGQELQKLNKL